MPMKISCIPRLFSISHSNYSKNKRSSQCDCWRKSKHSKCRYTCEKRRGLTGIYLQSSKQILCGPTPEKQGVPADHRNALFSFLGKSQALIHIKVYAGICFSNRNQSSPSLNKELRRSSSSSRRYSLSSQL